MDTGEHDDEGGFTLIEVVVAMMLLAVLALALLPSMIGILKASASNANIATATQILNKNLEDARTVGTTCTAVQAYAAATVPTSTDSRGVVYSITRSSAACPSSFPSTMQITVSVTASGSAAPVSTGTTLLLVASAS